jgi:iron complex outermembrane receptor protein
MMTRVLVRPGCFVLSRRTTTALLLGVLAPLALTQPSGAAPSDREDPWASAEQMVVIGEPILVDPIEQSSSVISFDQQDLVAKGIADVGDLAEFTPNLEIQSAFGASSPEIFIRGVGLRDANANAASAVAVVTDGVYFNSAVGQLAQLFDVRDVSVLRGPQGTLYGRNASAGVIRIESNRPSGQYGSRVNVTYGRFEQVDFDGHVEAPVLPNLVALRLSGKLSRRDGLGDNYCVTGPRYARTDQATRAGAYIFSCSD